MSKPPPTKAKGYFLEVTPHTLHAVRTAGRNVEFCAEGTFAETSRLQSLLQEWSEGATVSASVSVAPQPIWWHAGQAEESRILNSGSAVQRFAARFPHGFKAPLEVIGCTADAGRPVGPQNEAPWLLGVTPGAALASAAAAVIARGVVTAALGSATLNNLAAVHTALNEAGETTVRLWEIGQKQSHVFTIGVRGVEAVTTCTAGFETIFAAARTAFGVDSPAKAARLFFGEVPSDAAGARLAALLAPHLEAALRAAPSAGAPTAFACGGLTSGQTWFAREIAASLNLPLWQPDPSGFLSRLQLRLPLDTLNLPSIATLGALHLAASPHHDGGTWHPTWGDISRPAAPVLPTLDIDRTKRTSMTLAADSPASAPVKAGAIDTAESISPAAVAVAPSASVARGQSNAETNSRAESRGLAATNSPAAPPAPIRPSEPQSLAATRPALGSGPAPLPAQVDRDPAASSEPTPAGTTAETRTPRRANGGEGKNLPPREPVVIVVRKRGHWLPIAVILAVLGAALAVKFYLDGEANKAAAAQAHRAAANAVAAAEREKAAAEEQTRRIAEQIEQAEKRARTLAAANEASLRQIQQQTEAARQAEIAQVRREAEAQTRKRLETEQTSPSAAKATGSLNLNSRPTGADVRIDERSVGRTPLSIADLKAGRHVVTINLAGYLHRSLPVDITGSKVTELGEIQLERATGSAAVASTPSGVDFSIRTSNTAAASTPVRRGQTPARIDDLAAGAYVVHFNRPGWPERTESLAIDPGKITNVATTFQGGTVTLTSEPTGATVRRQGLDLGTTPLTLADIPPGETVYDLIHDEYEPLQLTGNVTAGRELKLEGKLLGLDRLVSESELRIPPRPYITTPLDLGRIPRSTPAYIKVSFVVLRDGSLYDIDVLDKVDRRIRERSIAAIAKWKYYPGVSRAGYPVNVRISIPVKIARG